MKIYKYLLFITIFNPIAVAEIINVYSERQQVFLSDIFTEFTKETGHEVEVLYLDKGVIDRLKLEGQHSIADLAIVADIGRLVDLDNNDLVQAINSPIIDKVVPAEFKHPNNKWVALTQRFRLVIVRDGFANRPKYWTELSDDKYHNSICIRSGTHPYNIALFSDYLYHYGKEQTKDWLIGIKNNLVRKPQGNDRSQIKAVANGQCDIAIANLYYYYKMLYGNDSNDTATANKVSWVPIKLDFFNHHKNISGVALTKHAKNKDLAIKLIEYMLEEKAQRIFADNNSEFPIRVDITMLELIGPIRKYYTDNYSLQEMIQERNTVSQLVSEVEFNY